MLSNYIRKKEYIQILESVYKEDSLDYLIALRDGLSIVINNRVNGKDINTIEYKGFVKYV